MAALGDIYFKLDTLKTIIKVLESKQQNGINLTVSISDQTNEHGQNISTWVKQSKEEQEANKPRYYVGNGGIFWSDGVVKNAVKKPKEATQPIPFETIEGDLPF